MGYLKLQPLFAPKKLGVVNSVEVSRRDRRSPRMSMISNDVRQSYRERNTPGTPDSRRMSANARCGHDSGDSRDPIMTADSLPEDYKVFNFDRKDGPKSMTDDRRCEGEDVFETVELLTNGDNNC